MPDARRANRCKFSRDFIALIAERAQSDAARGNEVFLCDQAGPVCRVRRAEISAFAFYEFVVLCAIPSRHEGRIAIVTTREVGCGGRLRTAAWLRSCRRTVRAHGEVVWSWPPDAEATPAVMMIRRSRGQESPVPGESTYKPSNHRAGNAGMSRLNLWFLPPAFLLAGGPWVRPSPGIPRALVHLEGENDEPLGRRRVARARDRACTS